MTDENSPPGLATLVGILSSEVVLLDTGALARLRRMDISGPGEKDFWILAVKPKLNLDARYMQLVKLMALLTPKGRPHAGKRLHNSKRAFGTALHDVGYPEMRLMRFLALPFDKRGEALERMVRWVVAKGSPDGINCTDIASLLLSDDVKHTRRLAETYYRAKSIPTQSQQTQEEENQA